jgi:hypothetical protein
LKLFARDCIARIFERGPMHCVYLQAWPHAVEQATRAAGLYFTAVENPAAENELRVVNDYDYENVLLHEHHDASLVFSSCITIF